MLSDEELIQLMEDGESDRVEFTSSAEDLDKCRKAICAFANDLPRHEKPGVLFIGLNDDGSCADLPIDGHLLETLGGLRRDGKIQPLPNMQVSKKKLQDCEVALVQVEPSDNTPVKMDGRCWIRVGPQRAQASSEEERRLIEKRRWGNIPYDMQGVIGATIEKDLDMSKFRSEYLPAAVSPEVLEENKRSTEQQMEALRLVTQDGVPTVTAILILGVTPGNWFPSAYVQFVYYDGEEVTSPVLDQAEVSGPLPNQLREIDDILKRNIVCALDTSGETHTDKPDYPFGALRELVRNAVIHRNYEFANTPVRLYWFSDRVEITSPGSVYGAVTRDNFGSPNVTAYRNPTVAEAMRNMGFMQRFGMGIAIARKALKENGNPPPEFDVQETLISTVVRKRK